MAKMIEVDNLGKKYRLGGQDKYYSTLRESLVRAIMRPVRRLSGSAVDDDAFWALRNVNFRVDAGEVVGIIGRNGAGKSTLLKLLSRITRPTEGCARLYGRVGSLLEVGTGFHPELTGRENIALSGTLLGMTRAEVKRKFDEIVDFAEIERFLDTPVKHYSSGMYVRLGFAIAAHLEPEILLVDEVLAVGDAQFQKKCLGKMNDVAKDGRTVLFVSHNMAAVQSICSTALCIEGGTIINSGTSESVCREYLHRIQKLSATGTPGVFRREKVANPSVLHVESATFRDAEGQITQDFAYGDMMTVELELAGECPASQFAVEFRIWTMQGQELSAGSSALFHGVRYDSDVRCVRMQIGPLDYGAAEYIFSFDLLTDHSRIDTWQYASNITITESRPFSTGANVDWPCYVVQHKFK